MSHGVELGNGQGEQGARRQSDGQIISGDRGNDLDLAENLLCNLVHASPLVTHPACWSRQAGLFPWAHYVSV